MSIAKDSKALVRGIDFPHIRNGGRWRQEQHFNRACFYADQLRVLGMADADVACLLSDLYWDASEETRLRSEAATVPSIGNACQPMNPGRRHSPKTMSPALIINCHEPWPHPWSQYFPSGVRVARGTLETGSMVLAALPDGAAVRRLTVPDFLDVIGRCRESFERELARSRYCGAFVIIVEGDLSEVILQARGIHYNALMSTIATWMRRYGSILFAGGQHAAADLAYRFLFGQIREVQRAAKALSKAAVG